MEKHKCRLCLKIFPNGSALGGHMRSHTINLRTSEQGEEIQSSPSSSRVEKYHESLDAESCIVIQDRESETEWSKDPNRRRSKRARKKNKLLIKRSETVSSLASWETAEPISSISDVRTTEEDLAFSLMMLSRDRGKQPREIEIDDDDDEEEDECENREVVKWSDKKSKSGSRKYKCGTCEKVFKSYQALGGHRASHKKEKLLHEPHGMISNIVARPPRPQVEKLHQCPYCDRVFSSGQALGGHKRSHFIGETSSIRAPRNCSKDLGIIDLNLPALGEGGTH
ncbi:Zinc finger protein ZAT9 [Linum grandiflorum]